MATLRSKGKINSYVEKVERKESINYDELENFEMVALFEKIVEKAESTKEEGLLNIYKSSIEEMINVFNTKGIALSDDLMNKAKKIVEAKPIDKDSDKIEIIKELLPFENEEFYKGKFEVSDEGHLKYNLGYLINYLPKDDKKDVVLEFIGGLIAYMKANKMYVSKEVATELLNLHFDLKNLPITDSVRDEIIAGLPKAGIPAGGTDEEEEEFAAPPGGEADEDTDEFEEEATDTEEDVRDHGREDRGRSGKKHKGIRITCIGLALVTLAVGGHHLTSVLNHKSPYLFIHGKEISTVEQVREMYTGSAANIDSLTLDKRVPMSGITVWDQEAELAIIHNFFADELEFLEYDKYEDTEGLLPEYEYAIAEFSEIVLGEKPVEYCGHAAYFNNLTPEGKEHILGLFAKAKSYYRNGATYTPSDVDDMIAQARSNMSRSK